MKKISDITRLLRLRCIALSGIAAIFWTSCSDDDPTGTYIDLNGGVCELTYGVSGGRDTILVYSDYGRWYVAPSFAGDLDWITIWPNEGVGDGRFFIDIEPNDVGFERRTSLDIVSEGRTIGSISVIQTMTEPTLELDFSSEYKRVSAGGETFMINVITNSAWAAEPADEATARWISIGEVVDYTQTIIAEANPTDYEREGTVRFYIPGTNVSATLALRQSDRSTDFGNATKTDIATILASMPGGTGTVSDNLYIEAYVISDPTTLAFGQKDMYVMDESGKGIRFEFTSQRENTFPMNEKLTIHMYGQSFVRDQETQGIKAPDFTANSVKQRESTSGIQPHRLTYLRDLDQYENTLVTFEKVEFALPMGMYVNISDPYQGQDTGSAYSKEFHDGNTDYGHLLRDTEGNLLHLYTCYTFKQRYIAHIPAGSGPITGIVMKRTKNGRTFDILRIRSHADNGVSDNISDAISRTVTEFGYWKTLESMNQLVATKGSGTLKTSSLQELIESGSNTVSLYWTWTHIRHSPATIDQDGNVDPAHATNVNIMYTCPMAQQWWNANNSTITDHQGEAWIITTSTLGATGPLKLAFTASSANSGPMYFDIEWAEDENTPAAGWEYIGEYIASEWQGAYQIKQYAMDLTASMNNKQNVVLRFRVRENVAARNNGSTISGSSRLGLVRITEM